jgi:CsoR family transcriptional regulator, copper-sensing transcriptional repressor
MASSTPPRGYTASKEQLLNRMRRIQGQVGGIERMVEEDRYCIDVITQIAAVQAALDKVALGLLDGHARHCVIAGHGEGEPEELTDELLAAVARLMRRG